ncbi:MAG: hypothetical protein AAFZ91_15885 [Pseudomonadota bacterium]
MKKSIKYMAIAASLPLALSTTGCESIDTEQLIGAGLGAVGGYAACQLSGANDTECAALVLAGAAIGYGISKYLDAQDEDTYQVVQAQALELPADSTETIEMTDSDTGNTIAMQPTNGFVNAAGEQCRILDTEYVKAGETYTEQDTFCLGPDGWGASTATPA